MREIERGKPRIIEVPIVVLGVGVAIGLSYLRFQSATEMWWAFRLVLLGNVLLAGARHWIGPARQNVWQVAGVHCIAIPAAALLGKPQP